MPDFDVNDEEFQFAGIPQVGLEESSTQEDNKEKIEFIFTDNNFNLTQWSQLFVAKVKTICQTIVPLVEVALIELLGNSESFVRKEGKVEYKEQQGLFECSFSYFVQKWLTNHTVPDEYIKDDAFAVFEKLKVVKGVKDWKHCAINTSTGVLTVSFTI